MNEPKKMRIGPEQKDWTGKEPKGNCPECGKQCEEECGIHPLGCIYGGPTNETAYWLIIEGCDLYHGEG